ncbi:hypothetical protein [Chitinivorax sp. B]|uniref:hypothetical protein n=1 Tax=Chitinivorax sp. B TaxID=2502235 RepID=UPI0010F9310E|nr:hypothetical protein [Chitinivorax sp. B]
MMKKRFVGLALYGVMAGQVWAHGDLKAGNGGVIVEGKLVTVEMVAKPDSIRIFLTDHGKPIDVKGVTGEVVMLSGSEKATVKLNPVAGNELSAKGAYNVAAGTKAIVKITLPNKEMEQIRLTVK